MSVSSPAPWNPPVVVGDVMKFSNCNGGIASGASTEQKKTIVSSYSSTLAGYIVVR